MKKRRLDEAESHLTRALELGDDIFIPELLQIPKAERNKAKMKRFWTRIGAIFKASEKEQTVNKQHAKTAYSLSRLPPGTYPGCCSGEKQDNACACACGFENVEEKIEV